LTLGTFLGLSLFVQAFQPGWRQHLDQPLVKWIGQAHQVGRGEDSEYRNGNDNRIQKRFGDVQRDTQTGDDEGELSDLTQAESRSQGRLQRLARQQQSQGGKHHLAHQYRDNEDDHRPGVIDDDGRLHHHAHRNKEDGTKKQLKRLNDLLNAFQIMGFR